MEYIWALLGLGFTLVSGVLLLQVYIQIKLMNFQKNLDNELDQIKEFFKIKAD